MSKYFEVLERLERGRSDTVLSRLAGTLAERRRTDGARARLAPVESPVAAPSDETDVTEVEPGADGTPAPGPWASERADVRELSSVRPKRLHVPFAGPLRGVDAVFNNIEALTMGRRPMTLVIAGASPTESVRALASSLGAYAEGRAQRVVIAALESVGGRSVLVPCHPSGGANGSDNGDHSGLGIDLHAAATGETLTRWREEVAPGADIVLIMGPPLRDSVDAALLASLCDGLVIVVVRDETHREWLTVAAERARLTRSPVLGVVVNNGHDETPSWFRRIMQL